ncbi:hypothetical protein AN396_13285 [Candidatus Epulonipiscium fishelsonii]|uniref:Uncharacterized protein n=1 Tax=Candidatus Epulonipiscium fishelsonii TaxID=77094 RepID=A0ACC8XGV1_9FIRM|nr:hypothetical protein AN396_13285 [Epulopiscium sp. SCG-B11WGA-EpuloA1]
MVKHYFAVLGSSVAICITVFLLTYYVIFKENSTPPIEHEAIIPTIPTLPTTPILEPSPEVLEPEIHITPTTKVTITLKDQEGNIVSKEIVDSINMLQLTENDIRDLFPDYDLIEFTEKVVTLEKSIYIEPEEVIYCLGFRGDDIGIVIGENEFEPIGLNRNEFSSYVNTLLQHELISINVEDRERLRQNPYYLENILQSISE